MRSSLDAVSHRIGVRSLWRRRRAYYARGNTVAPESEGARQLNGE